MVSQKRKGSPRFAALTNVPCLNATADSLHRGSSHVLTVPFCLSQDLRASVKSWSISHDLDEGVFLLAIFQELLCRYTAQTSVTLRVQVDGLPVHTVALSFPDDVSPYKAAEELKRRAEAVARLPLVSAALDGMFSYQVGADEPSGLNQQTASSPIHCSFFASGTSLNGRFECDPMSWTEPRIHAFKAAYYTLLQSALAWPDSPLKEVSALTEEDLRQLKAWNRTEQDYSGLRVDQLFELQASRTPDHNALTFEGKSVTYRTISQQTNLLANKLTALGVHPGTLVGICMERSKEMVLALLAAFKAGAAYLPLDPGFPDDRIHFMLHDARPLVVVTQSHLAARFSFGEAAVLILDEVDDSSLADYAETSPRFELPPDALAYVLYTSGSTGKPKGVQVSHIALTNLLTCVSTLIPLDLSDVLLATSTISFDISIFEIFAPLVTGARLVIAPRSVTVSGKLLADAIVSNGVTVLQATPSGWRVLLEAGWTGQPDLKMLTAGEPLDRTLANKLLDRGESLWNLYGPTEATIYATACQINETRGKISVGRPLPNYTSYIVAANGKQLPLGAVGELWIGGVGVAQGYLNRPSLTREKFLPDSFSGQPGALLYRTGDLARYELNGQIELLGRADNQVKLRGYRIELEEVEAILDSHHHVRKSIVKVVDIADGDQRLAAYVVPVGEYVLEEDQLRKFCLQHLPAYMVPTIYVAMEEFSLSPNGKVDRKAVPAILKTDSLHTEVLTGMPSDDIEGLVLECWRFALNVTAVSMDDNFFELGGHSLLAVRMVADISTKLMLNLPVSLLLESPTPRTFAQRIRELDKKPVGCLVPIQTLGTKAPLYLIHHSLGDVLIYRPLANCFAPERPVIGVQPPDGLTKRAQPLALKSVAAEYAQEILNNHPCGPFHLAGFSSGSVLAFETARQLRAAGHVVGLLALIDGDVQFPGPILSKPVRLFRIVRRKLCKIAFKFRDEIAEGPHQFVAKRLKYLWLVWRINNLKNSSAEATNLSLEQTLLLAENSYQPEPYAGSATLLRFHDEAWQFGPDPLMGWSSLINGNLDVVDFPGGHITGMSATRAPELAALLKSRLESAEDKVRTESVPLTC